MIRPQLDNCRMGVGQRDRAWRLSPTRLARLLREQYQLIEDLRP